MLRYILFAVVAIITYFAETLFPFLVPKTSQSVSGSLFGICSPIEKLKELNQKIHPVLEKLRSTPFFRTYKLNMHNECPFWAIQRMCNSRKCAICECTDDEIPAFWKQYQKETSLTNDGKFGHALQSTQKDCPQSMDEWCAEEENDSKAIYVNLVKNKESYTAYDGKQIWDAIYQENCMIEKMQGIDTNNTCTEETLLYQLVSGLHTSINMHVTTNYMDFRLNTTYPNHEMYMNSIGKHSERVKNLFFLYAVVLRAVNRAEPILRSFEYETKLDSQQDDETSTLANNLLDITLKNCEVPFKEGQLFKGEDKDPFQQDILLKEIQTKFYNISRILDCVSCEKCRLNGKLQIKGLGTALKLLFTQTPLSSLRRTELISLVNLMVKLSESVHFYENFLKEEQAYVRKFYGGRWIVMAVVCRFINQVIDKFYDGKGKEEKSDAKKKADGPQNKQKKVREKVE